MGVGAPSFFELMGSAKAAKEQGDHATALKHWELVRRYYPDKLGGFLGAIHSARSLGDTALVAQLAREAVQRFPRHMDFVRLNRRLEQEEAAAKRRARLPATPEAAPQRLPPDTDIAARLAEALLPTRQRKPSHATLAASLAMIESLEASFPGRADIRAGALRVLQAMRRLDDARQRGATWTAAQPDSVELAIAYAEVLDEAGDTAGARDLLERLRATAPPDPGLDAATISILSRLDDRSAEAVCAQALAAHPADPAVLREWACLPQRRGDWAEALHRWERAAALHPDNSRITMGLQGCRLQLSVDPAARLSDAAAFFGRFESLGGGRGGCEFGMIQREHGAEALGLLRWANLESAQLVHGLDNDFAGLGTIENTELTTHRPTPDREEWLVHDKTYSLGSHTFISPKDAPYERMLAQTARRLAYLRDALLEQLRRGEKIFVYKLTERGGGEAEMRAIWRALRRHGPNTLLCAVIAATPEQRGRMRKLDDGLYVGEIGHFLSLTVTQVRDFDVPSWKSVCSSVLEDVGREA